MDPPHRTAPPPSYARVFGAEDSPGDVRALLAALQHGDPDTLTTQRHLDSILGAVKRGPSRTAMYKEANIRLFLHLLESSGGDGRLLQSTCDIILHILTSSEQACRRACRAGAARTVVRVLQEVAKDHTNQAIVLTECLASLQKYEKKLGLFARLENAVQVVHELLRCVRQNVAQIAPVLRGLHAICKTDTNIAIFSRIGGIRTVLAVYNEFGTEDISETSLHFLATLAKCKAGMTSLLQADGVEILLRAVRKSQHTVSSIRRAVTVIANLSQFPAARAELVRRGALSALHEVLGGLAGDTKTDVEVARRACAAVASLAAKPLDTLPQRDIEDRDLPDIVLHDRELDEDGEYGALEPRVASDASSHRESRDNEHAEAFRKLLSDIERIVSADIVTKLVYHRNASSEEVESEAPSCCSNGSSGTSPFSTASLAFASDFESGNLHSAKRIGERAYELVLSHDTGTAGCTQWFYFRVTRMRAGVPYQFTLVNLVKPSSLFNDGMRPVLYSERDGAWRRTGSDILYYGNHYRSTSSSGGDDCADEFLYSLTFRITFPHEADTCYLAHCYPYSYARLQRDLASLAEHHDRVVAEHARCGGNACIGAGAAAFLRREVLCETSGGRRCDVLTITEHVHRIPRLVHEGDGSARSGEENARACDASAAIQRPVIAVSARVHPGESNASWIMLGVLRFLCGDSAEARAARAACVFVVVPMLNPDGVAVGNYRCSLAGQDLNRQWIAPDPQTAPTVYHFKRLLQDVRATNWELGAYVDIHGHSRKRGMFMYGCETGAGSGGGSGGGRERVLPALMAQHSPHFALDHCSFRVLRSKASTARVVVRQELDVVHCFTLEASLAGPVPGGHFGMRELQQSGYALVRALLALARADMPRPLRHSDSTDRETRAAEPVIHEEMARRVSVFSAPRAPAETVHPNNREAEPDTPSCAPRQ